ILPETDFEAGAEVAERLCRAIRDTKIPTAGGITASFGIAEFPLCATTGRELLAAADAAMYEAKRQGRNRVERANCREDANSSQPMGV
ncbi:MAG: diguanylate cyclase, partial [Acidobacteria bacterium]|nr:diguanylate cyclase [Acidobacteriota bacterium]